MLLLLAMQLGLMEAQAQDTTLSGTVTFPYLEFLVYEYDSETGTTNHSYNYSGLWDLDADGKKDSLVFIGNGGAHVYYYPRIVLSSNSKEWELVGIQHDFPYPKVNDTVKINYTPCESLSVEVFDMDQDGTPEILFRLDSYTDMNSPKLKELGIRSRCFYLDFSDGTLRIENL